MYPWTFCIYGRFVERTFCREGRHVEGRFVDGRFVEGRFVEGRFVLVPYIVYSICIGLTNSIKYRWILLVQVDWAHDTQVVSAGF